MLAITALFFALGVLTASAAPTSANKDLEDRDAAVSIFMKRANLDLLGRADGVAIASQKAPDEILLYSNNILVGSRGNRQDWDLKTNRNCVVKKWGKHSKSGEGWDAYIYCMRTIKPVTWDIRRIGEKPIDCSLGGHEESWTISHEETTSMSVSVEVGGAFGMFSASASTSFSNEIKDTKSHTVTTNCGNFDGLKCAQGGHALIESRIQEGWVHVRQEHKGKDGETNFPDWLDSDNPNGNGFWAGGDWNHYKYNALYPSGWDTWETTDDSCYAMGNIYYGSSQ